VLRIRQALVALIALGVVVAGFQLPSATSSPAAAAVIEIPTGHSKKHANQQRRIAAMVRKAKAARVPKVRHGRVCPTKNFWIGAGWGAPRGKRLHRGIDLGAKRGTPIFAIEAGRINRTKKQSNGSLQIVMDGRSGSMFYYGHMDKVLVRSGQKVRRGQVIGIMGDTGSPGAVHLHFEYWKSGRESDAINPRKLIRQVCRK
jgi:murein DD-endopeptidase MepM/ murein hydrolase activator NlpD